MISGSELTVLCGPHAAVSLCFSPFGLLLLLLFSSSVVSDSSRPCGPQHARPPCSSLSSRVCSDSCPWSRRCYLTISSSPTSFSFCLHSFPASGSFPVSWFFLSGGQSVGASASRLPVNIPFGPLGEMNWDIFFFFQIFAVVHVTLGSGRRRFVTWMEVPDLHKVSVFGRRADDHVMVTRGRMG